MRRFGTWAKDGPLGTAKSFANSERFRGLSVALEINDVASLVAPGPAGYAPAEATWYQASEPQRRSRLMVCAHSSKRGSF